MSIPARLALFAAALAVVFGAAFGAGSAVGPLDDGDDDQDSVTTVHDDHP